uniref:Rab-GAP TBC domain-containing protein n=1 Tax=Strongyloides papillosus TaxID=174720 RepID=A0A0N5BH58_STREA
MVNKCVGGTRNEVGTKYYKNLLDKAKEQDIDLYANDIDLLGEDNYTDPILRLIDSDLTRTLPSNKYFCSLNGEKIPKLRRILYAYRYYNTDIGYCQGLNRLAALGLLFLEEEDAFWFLVACINLQPKDYYNEKLLGVIIDQAVFSEIVNEKLPRLANHLKYLDVDFQLYSLKWFMTVFIDSLSHELYLKIFDCFLNEGNKVIFRFALALLKMCENDLLESKTFSDAHHILESIRNRNIQFSDLSNVSCK